MTRKLSFILSILFAALIFSTPAIAAVDADTVDGKHAADLAPVVHGHSTSEVTGLDATLAGKAETSHTHAQSQVTGLEASLAGKAEVLHNHDNLYQQKYGRVVVVAQTGGDYTNPADAAANYQTWCVYNGPVYPCLIKVMPGVYDIGGAAIFLADHIDLEGSGENVTVIKGAGVSSPGVGGLNVAQVISGLGGSGGVNEVRSLTVENYGTAWTLTGIANISKISHVTVNLLSSGGGQDSHGIFEAGVPTIELRDVKIIMSAVGPSAIYQSGGSSSLSNVSIQSTSTGNVANGLELVGAIVRINGSDIQALAHQLAYGIAASAGSIVSVSSTNVNAISNIPPPMGGGLGVFSGHSGTKVYVDHSSINGNGRYIWQLAGEVFVSYSKVSGGTTPPQTGNIGLPVCIGAYNELYQPYGGTSCGLQ